MRALASDTYGWITRSTTMSILVSSAGVVAPMITQQPSNAAVMVGQSASFSVSAMALPAPTYQWQLNSGSGFANIAGATNSFYATPPMALASSGWLYQCIVSNSGGTVTSSAAKVTVNPATPLTVTMQPGVALAVGQSTTFRGYAGRRHWTLHISMAVRSARIKHLDNHERRDNQHACDDGYSLVRQWHTTSLQRHRQPARHAEYRDQPRGTAGVFRI